MGDALHGTLFTFLLLQPFSASLQERGARALFALMCSNAALFQAKATQLIGQQSDQSIVARLSEGFTALTQADGLVLRVDRLNKAKFVRNFNAFLVNVRGCLLVK